MHSLTLYSFSNSPSSLNAEVESCYFKYFTISGKIVKISLSLLVYIYLTSYHG